MSTTATSRFGRCRLAPGLSAAFVLVLALAACSSGKAADLSSAAGIKASVDRATGLMTHGRFDDAEQAFDEILDHDPGNETAHFGLAFMAQTQKDPVEAKRQYQAALDTDPDFSSALFNLSILETADGNRDAAIDLLRRLIAVSANDAPAHFNLGLLLRDTGKAAEARSEMQRAVALDPALGPQADALGFRAK
jgi:Tfp pilus assembly protein PilF